MQAGDLQINAKSSMLEENNMDAACMLCVHIILILILRRMYSDRHVLGLLLCARVIALCFAVLAVLLL